MTGLTFSRHFPVIMSADRVMLMAVCPFPAWALLLLNQQDSSTDAFSVLIAVALIVWPLMHVFCDQHCEAVVHSTLFLIGEVTLVFHYVATSSIIASVALYQCCGIVSLLLMHSEPRRSAFISLIGCGLFSLATLVYVCLFCSAIVPIVVSAIQTGIHFGSAVCAPDLLAQANLTLSAGCIFLLSVVGTTTEWIDCNAPLSFDCCQLLHGTYLLTWSTLIFITRKPHQD